MNFQGAGGHERLFDRPEHNPAIWWKDMDRPEGDDQRRSLYFPDIVGTKPEIATGQSHDGPMCGESVAHSHVDDEVSELQVANYIKPTHEQDCSHPMYHYIQVSLQENLVKLLIVSIFTSSMRKTAREQLRVTYLVSSQNMDYVRDDMGMTNSRIGYVYLVDEKCKIRWAACAEPMVEEIEALRTCMGVLLNRHNKVADGKAS